MRFSLFMAYCFMSGMATALLSGGNAVACVLICAFNGLLGGVLTEKGVI